MGTKKLQPWSKGAWELAGKQHWVVTRAQLVALGMGSEAIRHRIRIGRLHPVMRGVYAVGRNEIDSRGRWMAAVLACGPHALLSHHSAAALLGICGERPGPIDVVVPNDVARRRPASASTDGRDSAARVGGRSDGQPAASSTGSPSPGRFPPSSTLPCASQR